MGLKCNCGSEEFEPLGIQERYITESTKNSYKVLFLVNCNKCHTTLVTNRLDYALRRKKQAAHTMEIPFYE